MGRPKILATFCHEGSTTGGLNRKCIAVKHGIHNNDTKESHGKLHNTSKKVITVNTRPPNIFFQENKDVLANVIKFYWGMRLYFVCCVLTDIVVTHMDCHLGCYLSLRNTITCILLISQLLYIKVLRIVCRRTGESCFPTIYMMTSKMGYLNGWPYAEHVVIS